MTMTPFSRLPLLAACLFALAGALVTFPLAQTAFYAGAVIVIAMEIGVARRFPFWILIAWAASIVISPFVVDLVNAANPRTLTPTFGFLAAFFAMTAIPLILGIFACVELAKGFVPRAVRWVPLGFIVVSFVNYAIYYFPLDPNQISTDSLITTMTLFGSFKTLAFIAMAMLYTARAVLPPEVSAPALYAQAEAARV